jgi:hypothetical protein
MSTLVWTPGEEPEPLIDPAHGSGYALFAAMDAVFSELAPVDHLTQRFGRLNRSTKAAEIHDLGKASDVFARPGSLDAERSEEHLVERLGTLGDKVGDLVAELQSEKARKVQAQRIAVCSLLVAVLALFPPFVELIWKIIGVFS